MFYIPQYNGYIADVANQIVKRRDGKRFNFTKATATSFTPNQESTPITGGQGVAPLAYINGQQTLDITFTSAEFSMELFEMANDINGDIGTYKYEEAKTFVTDASFQITLPYACDPADVFIANLTQAEAAAEGKYKVEKNASTTLLTFDSTVGADTDVEVFFAHEVADAFNLNVKTIQATARGEVLMTWPLLASATDEALSSVKGHLQISVPLARITALPGFDTSYKTAATNSITFSAMDAGRADESWYNVHYIPN